MPTKTNNKQIGLFFGSFNPIHIGHLILANYIIENTSLKEIWFVVSPQNPFKEKSSLLPEIHRYAIVERAIENDDRFRVSNIEFKLSKPSYTIDTLVHLKEKHPELDFSLIIGQDNLSTLHKWKNAEILVDSYKIYVYPRPNSLLGKFDEHPNIQLVNAPQMDISSTYIRSAIHQKKDIRWFLPEKAWQYISEMNFYR